jgi:outer membrane immunogenic protein
MKFQRLAIVAAAALAAGVSVASADGPYRAPLPTTFVSINRCAGPFTGFYIGANIGGAGVTGNHDWEDRFTGPGGTDLARGSISGSANGVIGGGQLGYNWQCGALVAGLEADFNAGDLSQSTTIDGFAPANGFAYIKHFETENNWFGTIRARMGLAYNNVMAYVTGGVAYADWTYKLGIIAPFGAGLAGRFSDSDTVWGWTVGGGIEALLRDNWTFRAEALYIGLPDRSVSHFVTDATGLASGAFNVRGDDSFVLARIALNYRFGVYETVAPVVPPLK